MDAKQKNYRLEPNFLEAVERLKEPIPGVFRGEVEVIRAAIRSEWQRVFPGRVFPGDSPNWFMHIFNARSYVDNDPDVVAFIVRDWDVTEKAGMKDLAWAMCKQGNSSSNDAKYLLDKLEEYLKATPPLSA